MTATLSWPGENFQLPLIAPRPNSKINPVPLRQSRPQDVTLTFSHVTEKFTPFGPLADEMTCHDDSMPQKALPDFSATARFPKEADNSFHKSSHDLNSSYDTSLSTG